MTHDVEKTPGRGGGRKLDARGRVKIIKTSRGERRQKRRSWFTYPSKGGCAPSIRGGGGRQGGLFNSPAEEKHGLDQSKARIAGHVGNYGRGLL